MTPSKYYTEYEPVPCSCGITHISGSDTYERFDLLLGHYLDHPIYKNTTRCKVCKEATVEKRVE